jgi:opacity protein-like surface antigen
MTKSKVKWVVTGAAAIASLALADAAAAAVQVEFKNVKGEWTNPVGGANLTYTNNNSDDAQVRWGVSAGQGGRSGYNFVGTDFSAVLEQDVDSSGAVNIGEFWHVNFPINSGGSISAITLMFTTDVWVGANFLGTKTFEYNFSHWETTNNAQPCANGGANNSGINSNGCADRVTMNFNSNSEVFVIDGKEYTLNIDGFLVNGSPTGGFWTREEAANSAYIRGKIDLYSVASAVPEPTTWALMIVGFGGAGAMVRNARRKQILTLA